VAISFGPFLCLCLKSPACCRAALLFVQKAQALAANFLGSTINLLRHSSEQKKTGSPPLCSAIASPSAKCIPADRIPHQFPGHRITRHINRLLPAGGGTAHAVHDSPQQGNAPRNDQDPKKKP